MNDTETEYAQGNNIPVAPFNSTPKNLPRIRTSPQTQQTQRVTNQERTPQPQNLRQPQPSGRGAHGNRGGRGGAPRRAAAESEHTIVRGSRLGKQITNTVVHNQCDIPESSYRTDMDYELLGDPPNVPRGSSSRPNDVDATMSDETGVGQGAVSRTFRRTLKQYCRDFSSNIICLLEPKTSGNQANNICFGLGFDEWVRIEAVGFSGGIWVLWNLPLKVVVMNKHSQFINLQVEEQNVTPWALTVVYGSPNMALRRDLFANLSFQDLNPLSQWLVCGDFNSAVSINETSNTNHFNFARCSDFRSWIFRESLVDLGYTGAKFTWMRGINSSTFKGARLDRALCNTQWRINYPEAIVNHLPMANSDHSPLVITTTPRSKAGGPARFRFNMAWSMHKDFLNCIRNAWIPDRELEVNKTSVAKALTAWNTNTFGNVFQRKKQLLARIRGIQKSLSQRATTNLIKLERRLRNQLDDALLQEEIIWYQRSREEWLRSGDNNTRYYHTATAVNKNRTKVKRLKTDNEVWLSDRNLLLDHIQEHFTALFSEVHIRSPNILAHGQYPTLTAQDWQEVNNPFKPEEIKQALFEMDPCKAPGPDGFTAGILPPGTNDTIISLIPKVANPESVKQLRPIGLCNVVYKLVTKTMASRLRGISKKLVGPHQTSFVLGRQIADNIIVLQEVLNSMRTRKAKVGWMIMKIRTRKAKVGWMIMKIDLEKAYDKLAWSFIEESLSEIGFNTKSALYFSNKTQEELQQSIVDLTGIPKVGDLGRYLGVPSVHGRLKKESFASLIEKMHQRLAGWRSKTLSLAGMLVLTQSVLSAIPYYLMQTTALPAGVISEMEQLIRNFLWGSSPNARKCHLVNWDTITKSKSEGGLGLRKLDKMNEAFLAKLGWRLMQNEDSLWTQRPLIYHATSTITLVDRYRVVNSYWSKDHGWNWEELQDVLPEASRNELAATIIIDDAEAQDSIVWRHGTSEVFSVSSAYDLASNYSTTFEAAKWNAVWKLKVPKRTKIFIWLAHHERIMTNSLRARRGMTENTNCWLCRDEVEDTDHVLRKCPAADTVWSRLLPTFYWQTKNLPFKDWLDRGIANKGNQLRPENENILFAVAIWWIWKWRNDMGRVEVVKTS
ncbi:uncharacterized protein LOC115999567 [Ipomoea triloba]|uniref:uncharacterized protein LOC115999567 n=1 Tax=Ipomoea triloba TaxID=35885 RepID=UPI00125D9990|nr:uncharacterized protein LOC115999567 [Ipomoea triloba]